MFDLNERVRSYLADVRSIPSVAPDARQRKSLQDLARRGQELSEEVKSGVAVTSRGLLRQALTEDGDSLVLFSELDRLRELEQSLEGMVQYAEAALALREGRTQAARSKLEEAILVTTGEVSADGYRSLAHIHKSTDRRTNFHAARGLLFTMEGADRDLENAGKELRESLSLDSSNLLAHFGYAELLEAHGDHVNAVLAYEKLITQAPLGRDPIAEVAYLKLLGYMARATTIEEVARLADSVLASSPGFEAERGELLRAAFEHPLIDDDTRAELREKLGLRVEAFASPDHRVDDPQDRARLAAQFARLKALLAIYAYGDIDVADDRVESEAIEAKGSEGARAVLARALADLWVKERHHVLSMAEETLEPQARMQRLVRCQDRIVRWVCEAVETNIPTDALHAPDICRLIDLITEMHATISDDLVSMESIQALLPSTSLSESLEPMFKSLFGHLHRTGRCWEDIDPNTRIDETVRALGIGGKMTEFANGEMTANTYERQLRSGGLTDQVHAHLALAQLYADQHRYDLAAQHGKKSVELDPRNAEANYLLGSVYLKSGKRLLGIERLREAADRFSHPEASALLAEDCARDDQPHLASQYNITALESLFNGPRKLTPRDIEVAGDWLRRARKYNGDVEPFQVVVDKGLPRKERKQRQKEIEALNAQRLADKRARNDRIAVLMQDYDRLKLRIMNPRATGRMP